MLAKILKFFKRDKLPPLGSLRPRIFRVEFFWFVSLGVGILIFIIMVVVGAILFHSQYFETYKESVSEKNLEGIINVTRLKNTIEKRDSFINEDVSVPSDPSF